MTDVEITGPAGRPLGTVTAPRRTSLFALVEALPGSLVERLRATLGWQNRDTWIKKRIYSRAPGIFTTGTRSLTIALTEAESAALGGLAPFPIRAVQLKGAIYIPSRVEGTTRLTDPRAIEPPSAEPFDEHAVTFTEIGEDGRFSAESRRHDSPRGALLLGTVSKIIRHNASGRRQGLVAPVPLGYGSFDDLRYQGQPTGMLILGVYHPWNARLCDFFASVPYDNPHVPAGHLLTAPHPLCAECFGHDGAFFGRATPREANALAREIVARTPAVSAALFRRYGAAVASAHRAKIIFGNPHLENVLPLQTPAEAMALYDWEHTREIGEHGALRQAGYCVRDVRNLINQLWLALAVADEIGLQRLVEVARRIDPVRELLAGYGAAPDAASRAAAALWQQHRRSGRCDDTYVQTDLSAIVARALAEPAEAPPAGC